MLVITDDQGKNDLACEGNLYAWKYKKTTKLKGDEEEFNCKADMAAGKYDFAAQLIDKNKLVHPALYVYIEKMNP